MQVSVAQQPWGLSSSRASSQPEQVVASHTQPLDAWAGSAEIASVPALFRMAVAKNPDGPYLGVKVGDAYEYQTYKQVEGQVEQFGSALLDLGLKPGDRVATFADNSPQWRIADFGISYAGGVHAPLYNQLSDRNVEYILKDSAASVLVVDDKDKLAQVLKSEANLPDLKTIIVTDDMDLAQFQTSKQLISWKDLLTRGSASLPQNKAEMEKRIADTKATDFGGMVYTSGSTGDPKGVLLSQGNWVSDVEGIMRKINSDNELSLKDIRQDDVYAAVLPEGHVMGRAASYAITAEGGAIAYPDGLLAFKKDMKIIKPTILAVTPLFFKKIYDEAEKKALKNTDPALEPARAARYAQLATAGVAALGGVALGLVGAPWLLAAGLAAGGAALGGRVMARLASKKAAETTKADAFQWAVGNARNFHEHHGNVPLGTRIKQAVAEKFIFPEVRKGIDQNTGGRIRIMMSGGAALEPEVEGMFRSAGYKIAQGYGLSETAGAAIMNDPNDAKLGTVGKPLQGVEARLGEADEIQLRGPNVFTGGYLGKPDKTAESFTSDGWYRTGDKGKLVSVPVYNPWKVGGWAGLAGGVAGGVLGSLVGSPVLGAALGLAAMAGAGALIANQVREDYYAICGRIKSQFKLPGGEYVAPEPIEESLKGSPYIQEAVVVGATDKDMVGALIVPKFDNLATWARSKGLPTEPADMIKHPDVLKMMREEAMQRSSGHANHERVRAVALLGREFTVEADEMTPSFKVKRPVVLERYAEQIKGMF